ncbi:six-hairpin glycosidase [Colletotrichum fioriniae PJ7]|uniref:Six-hairpin glycosidase n=1 Tax=Colletotrichum fioriniae PJ7 TaxID=1445577 RepID=A0A010R6A3_9PEZI|nr:six-hairpin glycosidase [Colletotrichum fioriniae PJ7]
MIEAAIFIPLGGVAAAVDLAGQDFRISINDETGAIDGITDPRFEDVMNWVSTGSHAPWLPTGSRWGLGYADLGQDSLHGNFWNFPQITKQNNTIDAVYDVGPLQLSHSDWDNFQQSAVYSEKFVRVEADNYTTITRETGSISLTGAFVNDKKKVSGQAVQCDDGKCYYNFTAGRPGRMNLVVTTENCYNTPIFLNVVPKYDDLIVSRTDFLIEN